MDIILVSRRSICEAEQKNDYPSRDHILRALRVPQKPHRVAFSRHSFWLCKIRRNTFGNRTSIFYGVLNERPKIQVSSPKFQAEGPALRGG
jgi:hypothetical protein